MSDADRPFSAEYAKSNKSKCKICKAPINKDSLRLGVMIQAPKFDGKIPLWHHFDCFFEKKTIASTDDVAHFATLRFEDQQRLKEKEGKLPTAVGKGAKGKGKAKASAASSSDLFSIEYAKSGRAACRVCHENIKKGEVRISKLDFESDSAHRYGPQPGWHHIPCFITVKDTLDFNKPIHEVTGFSNLDEDDQKDLKKKLKSGAGSSAQKRPASVVILEENDEPPMKVKKEISDQDLALKGQSDMQFSWRDKLESNLSKVQLTLILEENDQFVPAGISRILDSVSDCLTFGALRRCPECQGQLRLRDRSYMCTGEITEWTNCVYETEAPKRGKVTIPESISDKHDFLQSYRYVKRARLFPPMSEAANGSSSGAGSSKCLSNCKIALVGFEADKRKELEDYIVSNGGEVVPKIVKKITCVVAAEDNKKEFTSGMKAAKKSNVSVVAESFLTAAKTKKAAYIIKDHSIQTWGLGISDGPSTSSGTSKSMKDTKSGQKTMKVVVQGVVEPDPDCGLSNVEVLVCKKGPYNVVLGMVDIMKGTNSYYKMQLLKSKFGKTYHVFRAWGRVGTDIGGNKCDPFDSKDDAVAKFEEVYEDKTGNEWISKEKFKKKPNCFYPVDIDYGQDDLETIQSLRPGSSSKLHKKVQELICLMFDIDAMKRALTEFEIDLEKMPLGKLSKNQIMQAYGVLTELQNILQMPSGADNKGRRIKILDASNRFYTLIPHDFGFKKPPLLENEAAIKSKTEMLDSLLEIEYAYKLLKGEDKDSQKDPMDQHYEQLKTDIQVLPRNGEEFKLINTYLANTHAPTHHYSLELEDVFKIDRHGETDRYQKKCSQISSSQKKLLWHGSRLTNFAGIISQGLRIAPPEAPMTGYMFGKGIYFADMASKSANYCFATPHNPAGLLLLCEVELGNILEKTQATYITSLPADTHSTKGVGRTMPDPKKTITKDGVDVPSGKPVNSKVTDTSLLYNEYIVYDVNQVSIKYLLKVNFNYKGRMY